MRGDRGNTAGPAKGFSIAAVVLAAGRSRRMGDRNKLILEVDGTPMIRRVVEVAVASGLEPVVVVVGDEAADIRRAVGSLPPVRFVENERPREGLSASLRLGLEAVQDVTAVIVFLGDMPWIEPGHVGALVEAFDPASGREICVPVAGGRRGNPVLWSSGFFPEMSRLCGDVGAKRLMDLHADRLHEVPFDDDAVLRDVDTPDALGSAAYPEAPCPP